MEKCCTSITLNPAILTVDERMRIANVVTGESDILALEIMAGSVVRVRVETLHNDESPLPSTIQGGTRRAERHSIVDGGYEFLRNGVAAFYLNFHSFNKGGKWRRRKRKESEAFFNENKIDVSRATSFAFKYRKNRAGLSPSFIGGTFLTIIKDWGEHPIVAKTFLLCILDGDRIGPKIAEILDLMATTPLKRGRPSDVLLKGIKVALKEYKEI